MLGIGHIMWNMSAQVKVIVWDMVKNTDWIVWVAELMLNWNNPIVEDDSVPMRPPVGENHYATTSN